MKSSEVLSALIAQNAVQVETAIRADLNKNVRNCDPLLVDMLDYALLGGGKRLRPFLTLVSSRMCGAQESCELQMLAAAFEYLHTATLIHDDVLDHAEQRRGRKSVAGQYGVAAAILAGDWLHAHSMRLIGRLAGPQALAIFCEATTGMVDGEFLQMRCTADPAVTETQYLAVIGKKTAGLIRAACAVGALHGHGSPEQIAALACYGEKIGIAFQIIDDLLDYLGDEQVTGKNICNDLLEGKMTLPLIHALAQAEGGERAVLLRSLKEGRSMSISCGVVRQILESLGSFAWCRQRAEAEMAAGLAALSCFNQDWQREDTSILRSLALYVLSRDR